MFEVEKLKGHCRCQGPRSNFEIEGGGGVGGTISDSILREHKTLFLTNSL